jgi:hypothetical protein
MTISKRIEALMREVHSIRERSEIGSDRHQALSDAIKSLLDAIEVTDVLKI